MTGAWFTMRVQRPLALGAVVMVTSAPLLVAQRSMTQERARPEQRSTWLLVTTADAGWDSNVRFLEGEDPDQIRRVNSEFTAVRVRPRSSIAVAARGSWLQYERVEDFNTVNYGGRVDVSRRLTAFTSGWVNAGYEKLLSAAVTGIGLPLLAIANQTNAVAGAGVEQRLTALTTLVAEGGYSDTRFDDATLIPGHVLTGSLELQHRYNSRERYAFEARVEDGEAQNIPLRTQSIAAAWEPRVGAGTLRLAGGVTRASTGASANLVPTGVVQFSDSAGPGVLLAGVTRTVSQAFGIGQLLINDVGTVSYEYTTRRGTALLLAGNLGLSTPSDGVGPSFRSEAVTADMRRVLRSGVTFGLGASYRQRKDFVTASGYGGQVAFGYTLGSR